MRDINLIKVFVAFCDNDFINVKLCILQCLSGLLIWRANYMFTCSHASSIPSTTSFSGWHFLFFINILSKKTFFIRWNKTYFSAHPFSSPSWLPLKGQSFYYGNSVCYPFSLSHLYNIVNHSCGCLWKVNNFITFIKFLNLKYLAKETFNYD